MMSRVWKFFESNFMIGKINLKNLKSTGEINPITIVFLGFDCRNNARLRNQIEIWKHK